MLDLIKAGGWVMVPLILLGIVALAIVVERFWSLRRKEVLPPGLGEEVREWARGRQLDPAHIDVLRRNSPLGELLAAALDVRYRPRELIKERVEDVGRHVMHQLERFMNTLGSIASVGPLLGLLGTVIGMIEVFSVISVAGVGQAGMLSGGIAQALIATVFGLVIAVPALILFNFLDARIEGMVMRIDEYSHLLLKRLAAMREGSDDELAGLEIRKR